MSMITSEEARELKLFIDNDYNLYKQQMEPIYKNLDRKVRRGVFDFEKSVKLFMYLVDNGARKYVKQFGGTARDIFPRPARTEVARSMANEYLGLD